MRLSFLGAARQVPGSKFWLQTPAGNVLIDCGLYQGQAHPRFQNDLGFSIEPADIEWVLLTHAHIDHSGLLPRLYKLGFRGQVITTTATADLCELMLLDSAHIQEEDAKFDFKKWRRYGRPGRPPPPRYTVQDAQQCLQTFQPVSYDERIQLAPGLAVRFRDAGHILGSASIEVWIAESGQEHKLVFSGDIGGLDCPIVRDPQVPKGADFVIMESTYGDRRHKPRAESVARLKNIIQTTVKRKGQLLIPAFAVGRTQEVLFELAGFVRDGDIPEIPVFADSPMAVEATEIFRRHPECFDQEMNQLIQSDQSPFRFPGLRIIRTREESIRINDFRKPCIIISASGMCTGGRIRHHLRHHLSDRKDTLLFVGYQAAGTLGRDILDGAKRVQIFPGETHPVRCRVASLDGFSAHADQAGLLSWLEQAGSHAQAVFVVHGEEQAAFALSKAIVDRLGLRVHVPEVFDSYDLLSPASMQG